MTNTLDQPVDERSLTALMYAPADSIASAPITNKGASAPVTKKGLCKAFTTTLLLTGNVRHAESAILNAICQTELGEMSDDRVFFEAVVAAVSPDRRANAQNDSLDHVSSLLPFGLRRVLRLSLDLRHCFVLRILLGWSSKDCSRLLHLNIRRVNESTWAAAQELARIGDEEKAA
jgi:hypothetical protein